MSELASLLTTLAERLGTPPWTARAAGGVADRASAPGVIDLTGILAMPLDQFAREGQCLEIRVCWHTETLWFVPDERDAAALRGEGLGRGRVWTAGELAALMALPDCGLTTVRTLALAKRTTDGDIVEVRGR
jgi:hypothetical protein